MTYFTVSKSNNVLTSVDRNYICWRGGTPPKPPPHCLLFVRCVCRCQYNYIYFRELFLAAHFSRKFEKPSYGSEGSFLTLRTNDIVHFATYLLSKIVLYIIYVIICTYMGINWHRPRTTDDRRRTTDDDTLQIFTITWQAERGFARSMMVGPPYK